LTGELSNEGPSSELDARISPDLSFVNVAHVCLHGLGDCTVVS
jgi:hypothetical protein